MFSYYKTQGISLLDKLNELYDKYGYCLNTLHSFGFDGSAGMTKMDDIMKKFRTEVEIGYQFAGKKIEDVEDYSTGLNGLPKSDVLKYKMEGNCSVVVRTSGTEPKIKMYIFVSAETKNEVELVEEKIMKDLKVVFK